MANERVEAIRRRLVEVIMDAAGWKRGRAGAQQIADGLLDVFAIRYGNETDALAQAEREREDEIIKLGADVVWIDEAARRERAMGS